jgi:hypothetical protein
MTNKNDNAELTGKASESEGKTSVPGSPSDNEISNKDKEKADINPEDISATKQPDQNKETGKGDPKNFYDESSGEQDIQS